MIEERKAPRLLHSCYVSLASTVEGGMV